ncbi:AraC family transcriptional regulator [Oleiphilus messinensis]|uniref:AraC family transcriptional regulator n=1 Tax=Oleiphilus messinensis TaxID=141451 RepID=A0A1Y0I8H5_9GAMM|nr:AraC family transcriptional regulator [Oleiphilus messinensis]ARU55703.1 AraC family transcriptional regulator [Oleiphilus messinensis]
MTHNIPAKEQVRIKVIPELGGLELLQAKYHRQCFSRHVHEGYCIGLIEQGAQRFWRSGAHHVAPRDCIILVNADQVHDGRCADDSGWEYRAIYPLPQAFENVSGDYAENNGVAPWFPESVVRDGTMAIQLRTLFNVLECSENVLVNESYWLSTLAMLLQRHGTVKSRDTEGRLNRTSVELVREYLHVHYLEHVSIQDLAAFYGVNPCHLIRAFTRKFGMPPHAYQIQLRLAHAKQMIRQGISLATTAAHCGFTDQSHLTRHFKKALGFAPGRYAKACV